jgi:hypothetical protein
MVKQKSGLNLKNLVKLDALYSVTISGTTENRKPLRTWTSKLRDALPRLTAAVARRILCSIGWCKTTWRLFSRGVGTSGGRRRYHVIDGVFEPDPEQGVRFIAAEAIDADAMRAVQTQVRRRILRAFVRRGRIDTQTRKEMEAWEHGGGFSLDASVRIDADDRKGLERLLRYCARPPFAADRLEELDPQRLIYRLPKPGPDGRTQIILFPLELISRIAALVPPPRQYRHRYYGVLAPNSPLRSAVTALAPEAVVPAPAPKHIMKTKTAAEDPPATIRRSPARYLWVMLLARIYEAFPLGCPQCGSEMRIIAFITEAVDIRAILKHIGEPDTPPRIAQARGPPEWYEDATEHAIAAEAGSSGDPYAQPAPQCEYDQRISW